MRENLTWSHVPIDVFPSDEVYYQLAYYIMDGFLVLTCLVAVFLDVSMDKSGDNVRHSRFDNSFQTPECISLYCASRRGHP